MEFILDSASPNTIAWAPSNNGRFSVKSTYLSLVGHLSSNVDLLFRMIWHWKGMERVKLFLWQVASGSLMTNSFRFAHHFSPDASCSRCQEGMHETPLHALRDCSMLGDFWYQLVTRTDWLAFISFDICSWFLHSLHHVHHFNRDWPLVFVHALHFFGKARNIELFDHVSCLQKSYFTPFGPLFPVM